MCTYKLEITYVCSSSNTIMAMNDNLVYIHCLTANDLLLYWKATTDICIKQTAS